jgi:ABC-type dipeptide/oligopeptide/nickel transport system permease component
VIQLGVYAAVHKGQLWDRLAMAVALMGQSVPTILSAILAILVFSVVLRSFPFSGELGPERYVLPTVTIGWFISAGIVRLLRSSMLEVLDSEYVKFARSLGGF